MNETIKVPTVKEMIDAGYIVKVVHLRRFKVAYVDAVGRIKINYQVLNPNEPFECIDNQTFLEELATGGRTEVTVIDPDIRLEFTTSSRCRNDENYNKRMGVSLCLKRIVDLMLVCEWKNESGFKMRINT